MSYLPAYERMKSSQKCKRNCFLHQYLIIDDHCSHVACAQASQPQVTGASKYSESQVGGDFWLHMEQHIFAKRHNHSLLPNIQHFSILDILQQATNHQSLFNYPSSANIHCQTFLNSIIEQNLNLLLDYFHFQWYAEPFMLECFLQVTNLRWPYS